MKRYAAKIVLPSKTCNEKSFATLTHHTTCIITTHAVMVKILRDINVQGIVTSFHTSLATVLTSQVISSCNNLQDVAKTNYDTETVAYNKIITPYEREIYVITMIKIKINEHCDRLAKGEESTFGQ